MIWKWQSIQHTQNKFIDGRPPGKEKMQGVAFFRANFEMQIAQNSSSSTTDATTPWRPQKLFGGISF